MMRRPRAYRGENREAGSTLYRGLWLGPELENRIGGTAVNTFGQVFFWCADNADFSVSDVVYDLLHCIS